MSNQCFVTIIKTSTAAEGFIKEALSETDIQKVN